MKSDSLRFAPALCAALAFCASAAIAQQFPTRPLRLLVTVAPGGGVDLAARTLAPRFAELLGQAVVVENRTGAGGVLAMEALLNAPADGHTLIVATISTMVVIPATQPKITYDPLRDVALLTLVASVPYIILANTTLPVRSVADLVKLAKARPGALTYGSAGHATGTHLAAEYFSVTTGTRLTHVPYKGAGPAMVDMLAGQVALSFVTASSGQPHVLSGRARALGITSLARAPTLPEVRTVAEQGYAGFEVGSWMGLAVRAGTPAPVLQRLQSDAQRLMQNVELRKQLEAQGNVAIGGGAQEFERYLAAETGKWRKVIAQADIRMQ